MEEIKRVIQYDELPKNPRYGQIFKAPEGCAVGATIRIELWHKGKRVGMGSSHMSRNGGMALGRCALMRSLETNDEITVRSVHKYFDSLIFFEDCGWIGHTFKDGENVLADQKYFVAHATPRCMVGRTTFYDEVELKEVTDVSEKN